MGHGTPDFEALSERSNYRRDSQSTVAGPPSCASVALRRMLPQPSTSCIYRGQRRTISSVIKNTVFLQAFYSAVIAFLTAK